MSKSIPDWPAREPAGLLIKEPERLGTPDEQIAPEAAAGQNVRHSSTHRKTPGLSTGGVSGEELQAFANYFSFQAAEFFIVANHFAMQRDDPPSFTFPFRWQKRGVQGASATKFKRAGRRVYHARGGWFDAPAAICGKTMSV